MKGIQRHRNLVEDFIQLQEDRVVPEAQHVEASRFKESRSQKVAFDQLRVLAAV